MVLSNDNIKEQAYKISSFGDNIFVKIPITDIRGNSNLTLIKELHNEGLKINITGAFTSHHAREILDCRFKSKIIISVFSGRIANTGIDPEELIKYHYIKYDTNIKILWASAREIFNIVQAIKCNCDIITLDYSLLDKRHLIGKDLNDYSIETIKMFYNDAKGYVI